MGKILYLLLCGFVIITTQLEAIQLADPFTVAPTAALANPQYFPRVAYSEAADLWLVVWQDGLPTGDETARDGRAQDIYGCRIRGDGTVLDPEGIAICTAPDFQGRPVVASDGTNFVVLWQDIRSGKDWDVYGARVSANGTVLDPNGFLVSGGDHNQCFPELVYGGGNYYAIWLDSRNFPEYRLFGSRISASGSILDVDGKQLLRITNDSRMASWQTAPFAPGKIGSGWHRSAVQVAPATIVTNGSIHVITTQANYNNQDVNLDRAYSGVYIQTINATTGDTIGPSVLQNTDAAIEAVADSYSGLYQGNRSGLVSKGTGGSFFRGSMYYGAGFGAAPDVRWVLHSISATGLPGNSPWKIYWDSLQTWQGYRSYGRKPNTMRMAYNGTSVLCVGDGHRHSGKDNNTDIIGVILDTLGTPIEPGFAVATGTTVQMLPDVSSAIDGKYIVIWSEESRTTTSKIMARIVNQ